MELAQAGTVPINRYIANAIDTQNGVVANIGAAENLRERQIRFAIQQHISPAENSLLACMYEVYCVSTWAILRN